MGGTVGKVVVKSLLGRRPSPGGNVGSKFWKHQKIAIFSQKMLFVCALLAFLFSPLFVLWQGKEGVFPFNSVPICSTLPGVKSVPFGLNCRPSSLLRVFFKESPSFHCLWTEVCWVRPTTAWAAEELWDYSGLLWPVSSVEGICVFHDSPASVTWTRADLPTCWWKRRVRTES